MDIMAPFFPSGSSPLENHMGRTHNETFSGSWLGCYNGSSIDPNNTSQTALSQDSSNPMSLESTPVYLDDQYTQTAKEAKITSQIHRENRNDGLRTIEEIPNQFRHIFSSYPSFNTFQSTVLDDVLYEDHSVIISAPTGSGKTVIFELAIINLLHKLQDLQTNNFMIVYMAPIKALCTERFKDWYSKFSPLGLICQEVTGDSERIQISNLLTYNIVLTTPEKWDSLTRVLKDSRMIVEKVKLFLLDEVHLLNDDQRGPVLEAVVSRMKTLQANTKMLQTTLALNPIRFVAVSATIPNIGDVSSWLSTTKKPAKYFSFGEEYRPVKLKKIVLGYNCRSDFSQFKFDMQLSYKLRPLLFDYANGKPALIFCSTRKGVIQTADILSKQVTFHFGDKQKEKIMGSATEIKENEIRKFLIVGVGCHHAGMDSNDRHIIEDLFRNGNLPVLITTSTLAMGVNLPAHLVIIKSTQQYSGGAYQEYSTNQILQMIGRAGRPQYDTQATAIIMTQDTKVMKYTKLVEGTDVLESHLHKHLAEHLNSEIVLSTITEKSVAINWIRSTFLYVRALRNPTYYGIIGGLSPKTIEDKLQEMCIIVINALANENLVKLQEMSILPTETGRLMAQYYVTFETMKTFSKITGTETLPDILNIIAECGEFSGCKLRVSDKRFLNEINKSVRFPIKGLIKTHQMKISCLIQAIFGGVVIQGPSLHQESLQIIRIGIRITKCLTKYLSRQCYYQSLLNATILEKCFYSSLWENSEFISRQLEGIGVALSQFLVSGGKTTFKALANSNPRDIERIISRAPPMGNKIKNAALHMPEYSIYVEKKATQILQMHITVKLENYSVIKLFSTPGLQHRLVLIAGDADNVLLLYQRFQDELLINNDGSYTWTIEVPTRSKEIGIHVLSEEWVGMDVTVQLTISKEPYTDEPLPADKNKQISKTKMSKETQKQEVKTKTSSVLRHLQEASNNFFKDVGSKKLRTGIISKSKQLNLDQYLYSPREKKKLQSEKNSQEHSDKMKGETKGVPEEKHRKIAQKSHHSTQISQENKTHEYISSNNLLQSNSIATQLVRSKEKDKTESGEDGDMISKNELQSEIRRNKYSSSNNNEDEKQIVLKKQHTGTQQNEHKNNTNQPEISHILDGKINNEMNNSVTCNVPFSKYYPIFLKDTVTNKKSVNETSRLSSERQHISSEPHKSILEKFSSKDSSTVVTFDIGIEELLSCDIPETPQMKLINPKLNKSLQKRGKPIHNDSIHKLLYGNCKKSKFSTNDVTDKNYLDTSTIDNQSTQPIDFEIIPKYSSKENKEHTDSARYNQFESYDAYDYEIDEDIQTPHYEFTNYTCMLDPIQYLHCFNQDNKPNYQLDNFEKHDLHTSPERIFTKPQYDVSLSPIIISSDEDLSPDLFPSNAAYMLDE